MIHKQLQIIGGRPSTTLTIDFAHEGGVSNVRLPLFDVDGTLAGSREQVVVTATAAGSIVDPTNIETSEDNEQVGDNAVRGTALAAADGARGNATFGFSQSGITQIQLVLTNQGAQNTNQGGYSLHDISFQAVLQPLSVEAPDDLELTVGRPADPVSGTATGGDEDYTYAVTPALPTGLTLDTATGVISGTPTAPTTDKTVFTYTATDGVGTSDSDTFGVTVNLTPLVTAPADQTYTAGVAITAITLDFATRGTRPFTYELSTNLPAGLSFNPTSRVLSGTPTTATTGAVTVTYTATDANDAVATDTFDITVDPGNRAPTVANAIPDQAATTGTAFSYTFAANTFNDGGDTSTPSTTADDDALVRGDTLGHHRCGYEADLSDGFKCRLPTRTRRLTFTTREHRAATFTGRTPQTADAGAPSRCGSPPATARWRCRTRSTSWCRRATAPTVANAIPDQTVDGEPFAHLDRPTRTPTPEPMRTCRTAQACRLADVHRDTFRARRTSDVCRHVSVGDRRQRRQRDVSTTRSTSTVDAAPTVANAIPDQTATEGTVHLDFRRQHLQRRRRRHALLRTFGRPTCRRG